MGYNIISLFKCRFVFSEDNGNSHISAITMANVEALTGVEIVSDCDYICIEDKNSICVLEYTIGWTTYCLNKAQRR